MHDSISTDGPQRPRVRRGLGVVVGMALMAGPFALAPAAQAQAPVSPDLITQIVKLLQQIVAGLGHTLQTPLGEQAPNALPRPCEPRGSLAELLTCIIAPLQQGIDPGQQAKAKAKVKASTKNGKVASVRWVK
jgi:hypothetical protein